MVLESLVGPNTAKKHPLWLFVLGVIFSAFSVFFGLWIFKTQASLVMVFLTVVMTVPLMYSTLVDEEKENLKVQSETNILKEHSKALTFLSFLFLGFVVGYSLCYLFLPSTLLQTTFNVQLDTINTINSGPSLQGNAINFSTGWGSFFTILTNNFKVLLFCLLFAFFFGAGSIFILAWNASVISAAVGTYFRNRLASYAGVLGFSKVAVYFNLFTISFLRYMIHGIFEIVAYFVGGLAGGIISIALIKHGAGTEKFNRVMYDALILMVIALFLLFIGGLIEVFITPMLF